MAELDQLSEIIGTLRAEVRENRRQHEAAFKKLDAIEDKLTELNGAVKLLAEGHAELKRRVDLDIAPAVSDYKAMKNKGLGVIAFIGLLGSGVGAGMFKFLSGH